MGKQPPLKRSRQALSRANLDGTHVVLRLDDPEFLYSIDGLAAWLWERIDDKTSREDLLELAAVRHKKFPRARLEQDLDRFLSDLRSHRLLEP